MLITIDFISIKASIATDTAAEAISPRTIGLMPVKNQSL